MRKALIVLCLDRVVEGFVKQVENFGVLRVAWGVRYVHLSIMVITSQQVILKESLVNIDVIRKHVMLSGEDQHKAQTTA